MSSDSSGPTLSDPFHNVSEDDRSALIVIVAVVAALITVTGVLGKLGLQYYRKKRVAWDGVDVSILGGGVLLIVETACVIYAVNLGLGKHRQARTDVDDAIPKLQYASAILGLAAITCAKLSTALLIKNINDHDQLVRVSTRVLLGVIAAEFVTGLFASAFQCPLPTPWLVQSPSACPAAPHVYLYNGVMNIITDLLLCALSVAMIWGVMTNRSKKILVVVLFQTRLLCPIATVFTLTSTEHLYNGASHDFTWLSVSPTIWAQVTYNLSLITACIPSLKYVFENLKGGFTLAVDAPYTLSAVAGKSGLQATAYGDGTHQGSSGRGGAGGNSNSSGGGSKNKAPRSYASTMRGRAALKLTPSLGHHHQADCFTEGGADGVGVLGKDDGQSESVQNLKEGVIMIREEVEVHHDFNDRGLDRESSPESGHRATSTRKSN